MSNIKHTACPRCQERGEDRSGDNLAVYPDNSAYCFKCGYYRSASGYIKKSNTTKQFYLPKDCTWEIPLDVKKWLFKYIDMPDLIKYRISYSPYWNQIIIPIGINEFLSRNFNKDKPKWYFRGEKPKDYILGNSDTCVLCEDILSGIRIVKAGYSAHILFGTNIPLEAPRKLYSRFSRVRVWLDMDAQSKAVKSVQRLSQFHPDVGTISTPHDPKEYSIEDIKGFVK